MTLYMIRNKGMEMYVINFLVMADIPQSIRHLVVDEIMQGESQLKVGIQLNICLSTVNRIWMHYKKTRRTDNRVRSGRPKITTERQ